jgi:hypothetical protein
VRLPKNTTTMSSSWCNRCGEILTPESAYIYEMLSGKKGIPKKYMANLCKPCKMKQNKIRYNLEKKHPRPPSGVKCECCGRIDKLHLDHDHAEEYFRGFCCRSCNIGLGHLGDSIKGVTLALEYLKRANERRDADATGPALADEGLSLSDLSLPLGAQGRFACDNEAGENILGREAEYNIA